MGPSGLMRDERKYVTRRTVPCDTNSMVWRSFKCISLQIYRASLPLTYALWKHKLLVITRDIFSAVELIFRVQVLMFVPVTTGNSKHRSYPRSLKNENTRWRDCINTIRQEAPLIYRNRTLFEDFRQSLEGYVINTRTYCMNVTRHQHIKPYAHFDFQSEM